MKHGFDVVIVGGGHAGTEAAFASARMGARTCLVTHRESALGEMSCNPAIGGLGKGHLVREIDALDGVMGRAADYAGIQFRLLNRRKGPAVQGPRTQADRDRYRSFMRRAVKNYANITLLEGEVTDLLIEQNRILGVTVDDDIVVSARSVVLTTGTFLNGKIFIGDETREAGRVGDPAVTRLATRVLDLGLPLGRLKTGTPARLCGKSIDWTAVSRQDGDDDPTLFSFLSKAPTAAQTWCGITNTNERTHEIIEKNIEMSAIYGGFVDSTGPRYCPSIEDKVVRFRDKASHQIFLEPETLDRSVIYPNGISTSLPAETQKAFVRTIPGLEDAKILQLGYAIEYDYVDPNCLDNRLGLRSIDGLFLAGQINGTTGYEEAAAQGLVAGVNAAAESMDKDAVTFSRADSYIGVMIDDLITKGVTEPYRMFTSRAEFRLHLRADNADQRLTPKGIEVGLVKDRRSQAYEEKAASLAKLNGVLDSVSITGVEASQIGIAVSGDGRRLNGSDLLRYPDITAEKLVENWPELDDFDPTIVEQAVRDGRYASYVERQKHEAEALKRDESVKIPQDLVFLGAPGISNELAVKLDRVKPATIGQASRIEGMTPAALSLVLLAAKKPKKKKPA